MMRVIMIGGDETVYHLARQFVDRGDHVTVINRKSERAKTLARLTKATVVLGEGTDIHRLEEAGARRADILLALTPFDPDNLIACQIAQKMFGVPRTMALVNDPDNEEVFKELGISVSFSATRVIASLIEQQAHFTDITTLMPLAQGKLIVSDVYLDGESPAVGQSLSELDLTEGSLVASIIRDGDAIVPRGATRLLVGDHLILISHPEHHNDDLVTLCGHDS